MHQSIPSANIPPGGNFFEIVKSPAPGANFYAKAWPLGQKSTYPRDYFRRSSTPFQLIGVEISEFCRNQIFKKIGSLSNYSFAMPYSFSLSTILDHFKVSPNSETDFVTRKMMTDQFQAENCFHAASTDNLRLMITDNSPDPGQPLGNSDGTNSGTRAESRCKTPGVAREMLALGIDWCIQYSWYSQLDLKYDQKRSIRILSLNVPEMKPSGTF